MNCKEFEEFVILYLYDELSDQAKREIEVHVNACSTCRKLFVENKRLLKMLDTAEDNFPPEWDLYWSNINQRVGRVIAKQRYKKPVFKWGTAMAASVLLLVIGFLTGIYITRPTSQANLQANGESLPQTWIHNYFEEIRPLLADYVNYSTSESNGKIPVEDLALESLLLQTRLLKRQISYKKDAYLNNLVEHLELILMEIHNTLPGDKESIKAIQQIIKDQGIPLKIQLYKPKTPREEKI